MSPPNSRPGPIVPDQPITRARKDSIVRPINTAAGLAATPVGGGASLPAPPGGAPLQTGPQDNDVSLTTKRPDGSSTTESAPPGVENPQIEQEEKEPMSAEVEGISVKEYDSMIEAGMKDIPKHETDDPVKKREHVEDMKRQMKSFGDYPGKGDPNAPNPPVKPGRINFNPFTGSFTDTGKPSFMNFIGVDIKALTNEFYSTGGGKKN